MGIASVYRILKTHRQDNPEIAIPGSQGTQKIALVEVFLRVENNNKWVRGKKEVRQQIEQDCFLAFDMLKKDKEGCEYILKIPYCNEQALAKTMEEVMQEATSIAKRCNGFIEMRIKEPTTGKTG